MKRRTAALILALLGILIVFLPLHIAMTGFCLLALAAVLLLLDAVQGTPREKLWRALLLTLTGVCAAAVLGGMTYIALDGRDDLPETNEPEFVVVLGAQVYGDQPSLALRLRLERAEQYLNANPEATVFLCGGQGSNEEYSESYVMEQYLLAAGIDASRIHREEHSSNTRENLYNSRRIAEFLQMPTDRVLIITSSFHLCRAKYIARTLGMTPFGLGSDTRPKILEVNYLLREVFAFVKAWITAEII